MGCFGLVTLGLSVAICKHVCYSRIYNKLYIQYTVCTVLYTLKHTHILYIDLRPIIIPVLHSCFIKTPKDRNNFTPLTHTMSIWELHNKCEPVCHQILVDVAQPEKWKSCRRIINIVCIQHRNYFQSHCTEFIPWKCYCLQLKRADWFMSVSNTSIEGHGHLLQAKRDSTLKNLWDASSSFKRRNA